MEGYILTWTNFIKGWRLRYLILDEKENMLILNYKKTENKKKSKYIEIKNNSNIIDDKKTKFSFRNSGENLIYFKAKTKEEKDNWILNLNNKINSLNNNEVEKDKDKDKEVDKEKNININIISNTNTIGSNYYIKIK
jgi:hypothetical protein